jgi:polysaccharide export outer membrane protein
MIGRISARLFITTPSRSVRVACALLGTLLILPAAVADAQFAGPSSGGNQSVSAGPQTIGAPTGAATAEPSAPTSAFQSAFATPYGSAPAATGVATGGFYTPAGDMVLLTGDVITVRIFGQPEYASTVRIGLDGTVDLPLIGHVPIDHLNVNDAEAVIRKHLIDAGMYRMPDVFIQISDLPSRYVTLAGEAHGIIPLTGDRRILDVLASANLPLTASRVIYISREGHPGLITVDLSGSPEDLVRNNIVVQPHDTIIVRGAGSVYCLGAFKIQGAIPLAKSTPLTLLQAMSIAQGYGWEGETKDLRLIRTVGGERRLVSLDYGKVQKGLAPDPILQADDIIFLPTNRFREAIKSGGLGVLFGIVSILLYFIQYT